MSASAEDGSVFDPETARLSALTALRAWTRQRDRMPEQRAVLLGGAWRAGERNIRELARIADVSRQTVYDDLRAQGIDPREDRDAAITPPRYAPLTHEQVADLAEHMQTVLLPSMLASRPEPLAVAAWMAHKAMHRIARLLNPAAPDLDRPAELEAVVDCADAIRHATHQQWAAESTDADLARRTFDAALTICDVQAIADKAVLTMTLPDGMSRVQVTISTAGHRDAQPDGWTQWATDSPLPLAPVDGLRHLEISSLLAQLGELITQALHPELLEER